jgi:hypothetical protein
MPKKISELPIASTNGVDGAIIIPVIQDGVTKQIALTNLLFPNSITSGRIAAQQVGSSEVSEDLTSSLRTAVAAGLTADGIGAASTSAVLTAQARADLAVQLAEGKVTSFYQVAVPTPTGIGDIWINADTHQVFRSGDGISFNEALDIIVDGSITTNKLAANCITANQITAATINAIKISAQDIDVTTLKAELINALVINSDTVGVNTLIADNIKSNEIETDHLKANIITAREIFSGSITANEIAANSITTDVLAANQITSDLIAANQITADQIKANNIFADAIMSNAVTSDAISSGSVAASQLATNCVTTETIVSGSTVTGNLSSLQFDGQITGPDSNNEYSFNLGTKGFYMHGDSGTAVVNTLIARNNIITGNMMKFDDDLHGLETDANGNIKVKTDGETMTVENGAIKILSVPSNAVVNAYKDINWTGFHNGIALQTYTFSNERLVSIGSQNNDDGSSRGIVTNVFKINLEDYAEDVSKVGTINLYNLTVVIDPRGIANLAGYATGGHTWRFYMKSRWSSSANNTGSLTSLSTATRGHTFFSPYGDTNPVLPSSLIEHKITKWRIPPPTTGQQFLHVWVGMQIGVSSGNSAHVSGDNIKVGVKGTNDTYMTMEVSGTLPAQTEYNMSDLIDNQNLFGDYA